VRCASPNANTDSVSSYLGLCWRRENGVWLMSRNPEARGISGWNTDDIDALMAKIDAAAEAMDLMGDPDRGTKVLHGVGRSA
jgi:hypothetical protein